MRILDNDSNKALKNITLYITISEAKNLNDDLQSLINDFSSNNHVHVNDGDYTHEITVAVYDDNDFDGFNQRSKLLIEEDI